LLPSSQIKPVLIPKALALLPFRLLLPLLLLLLVSGIPQKRVSKNP
jgi:hypothetical protein